MNASQREAWFNLIVVLSSLLMVTVLLPFLGKGAMGGFGLLGFLGFSPLFFRKRPRGRGARRAGYPDSDAFAVLRPSRCLALVCRCCHDGPSGLRLEWDSSSNHGNGKCLLRNDGVVWGHVVGHADPVWSGRPRCRLTVMLRERSAI